MDTPFLWWFSLALLILLSLLTLRQFFRLRYVVLPYMLIFHVLLAATLVLTALTDLSGLWLGIAAVLGVVSMMLLRSRVFARELRKTFRSLATYFGNEGPARPVDAVADYNDLDQDFYDWTQSELSTEGFGKVGDFVFPPGVAAFPKRRRFDRRMLSRDGRICATIAHLHEHAWLGQPFLDLRLVLFLTEFDDGTFLTTSSNSGYEISDRIDGVTLQLLAPGMEPLELLRLHREALDRAEHEGGQVRVTSHPEDVDEVFLRLHRRYAEDRRRHGLMTEREFLKSAFLIDEDDPNVLKNKTVMSLCRIFRRVAAEYDHWFDRSTG